MSILNLKAKIKNEEIFMKKVFMFTATTLGFFVVIIALFWLLSQKNDNITAPKIDPPSSSSGGASHVCAKEEKEKSYKSGSTYCVKEYKGNIAVFEQSKEKPFKITNIAVDELPTEDQKLLKKGIEVSGQEELNNLIEDYCS